MRRLRSHELDAASRRSVLMLLVARCPRFGLVLPIGWLLAYFAVWFPASGFAQPAVPHIGYIYPAGGRQGTKFEITIGGQFLDGVTNVYVSGGGVQTCIVEHEKPLTPKQAGDLRDQMKALQAKRQNAAAVRGKPEARANPTNVFTAGDREMLMEIRKKLATFIRPGQSCDRQEGGH